MRMRFLRGFGGGRRRGIAGHLAGLSDINLVSRALEVETLRKLDRPLPADIGPFRRIAVLAPHQDDELIGAGGLCQLARRGGADLAMVFLTDGAERNMTDRNGRSLTPPQSAAVRQAEADRVCAALEARCICIGIDNDSMAAAESHVDRLHRSLADFAPDLILLPWLFDSAPKHRIATHLLWLARRLGSMPAAEIWGYQVNNGLFANRVLDITEVMERKLELIGFYESQNTFLRRYDHQAMGLGAWNSRYLASKGAALSETYAELFFAMQPVEFDDLVERFYIPDLASAYCGSGRLTRSMTKVHSAVMQGHGKQS